METKQGILQFLMLSKNFLFPCRMKIPGMFSSGIVHERYERGRKAFS